VQNVYLFGSPVVVRPDEYLQARAVVSGRFVNGYNRNDWILGYLFRLTNGGIRRIAGLAAIQDIPGLENLDVTDHVMGHMDYRMAMPRLLRECDWLVESDEFTEIENPDPENHQKRQRELISEISEARKQLEKEGKEDKGGAFGFFSRSKKKAVQRQEWEVYGDAAKASGGAGGYGKTEDKDGNNYGVLFDVDAIRAELAKERAAAGPVGPAPEQLQVKELQSTLPPMKIPSPAPASPPRGLVNHPREALKQSKSAETAVPRRSSGGARPGRDETPPRRRSSDCFANAYPEHGEACDEGNISMTFDTSFEDETRPARASKDQNDTLYGSRQPSESPDLGQPAVKTAQTVPTNFRLADPWAEDEDPDFGKEKEIQLTFA
jgi:hypothetical protein